MIRFFDTLEGKLRAFDKKPGDTVSLYACGPTVYDYAHIGNFRTFVFEDLLRRFLEVSGFAVKHVMNITDVDDKTIAGANRTGQALDAYTERYTKAFYEDLEALHILLPNCPAEAPRATREIPAMVELIRQLIDKGHAYAQDGSVYFRVSTFSDYGKLSKKKLERNIDGARVDSDEYEKEQAHDFVLWKKAKPEEPAWDSPWGRGRPGWHIECSAMSMKYLGASFDIHAGGEDLIFPHHENEIAQSEAATGTKPFVRYWIHCRFLLVDGQKMSKSLGNFYTLRDLLERGYDAAAIRYGLLSTHYRTPLNFTLEGLKEAQESVRKLDDAFYLCLSCREMAAETADDEGETLNSELDQLYRSRILTSLEDDLNISEALAALFECVRQINRCYSQGKMGRKAGQAGLDFFKRIESLFGFGVTDDGTIPEAVRTVCERRNALRARAEFRTDPALREESDKLRDEMGRLGWNVRDARPGGLCTVKHKRRKWDAE